MALRRAPRAANIVLVVLSLCNEAVGRKLQCCAEAVKVDIDFDDLVSGAVLALRAVSRARGNRRTAGTAAAGHVQFASVVRLTSIPSRAVIGSGSQHLAIDVVVYGILHQVETLLPARSQQIVEQVKDAIDRAKGREGRPSAAPSGGECWEWDASPEALRGYDPNAGRWVRDPLGRHEYRYWDGTKWTEHVSDQGAMKIDPVGASRVARRVTSVSAAASARYGSAGAGPWND